MARGGSTGAMPVALSALAAEAGRYILGMPLGRVSLRIEDAAARRSDRLVAIKPRHLLQVLTNLVVNGIDAMDGQGDLSVRWDVLALGQAQAAGLDLASGEYLRITVTDSGCGMSESALARAFEAFFTTKSKEEGTGLGLAISLSVARDAGGNIVAASGRDQGSEFSVYLPTTKAA
jgi:signal transduction histidine kinase